MRKKGKPRTGQQKKAIICNRHFGFFISFGSSLKFKWSFRIKTEKRENFLRWYQFTTLYSFRIRIFFRENNLLREIRWIHSFVDRIRRPKKRLSAPFRVHAFLWLLTVLRFLGIELLWGFLKTSGVDCCAAVDFSCWPGSTIWNKRSLIFFLKYQWSWNVL